MNIVQRHPLGFIVRWSCCKYQRMSSFLSSCCCSTLEGIGKTLNPNYNFSEVATPYAQELLQIQEMGQQGFIIEQLQQQATEVSKTV